MSSTFKGHVAGIRENPSKWYFWPLRITTQRNVLVQNIFSPLLSLFRTSQLCSLLNETKSTRDLLHSFNFNIDRALFVPLRILKEEPVFPGFILRQVSCQSQDGLESCTWNGVIREQLGHWGSTNQIFFKICACKWGNREAQKIK